MALEGEKALEAVFAESLVLFGRGARVLLLQVGMLECIMYCLRLVGSGANGRRIISYDMLVDPGA